MQFCKTQKEGKWAPRVDASVKRGRRVNVRGRPTFEKQRLSSPSQRPMLADPLLQSSSGLCKSVYQAAMVTSQVTEQAQGRWGMMCHLTSSSSSKKAVISLTFSNRHSEPQPPAHTPKVTLAQVTKETAKSSASPIKRDGNMKEAKAILTVLLSDNPRGPSRIQHGTAAHYRILS